MCLAIPMQVLAVRDSMARCAAGGVERDVNLFLLQDRNVSAGDFVLVHVGYAIQKVEPEAALSSQELYGLMQGLGQANA